MTDITKGDSKGAVTVVWGKRPSGALSIQREPKA